MIGLEPLLVVFVGHFFFKDKTKWFHWLFGAMAFIGVAILINGGKIMKALITSVYSAVY